MRLFVLSIAFLCFAFAPAARPSEAGQTGYKWHPGHYALVSPMIRQSSYAYPEFRGIQKFYNWRTLEPQKDHYDFSEIKSDLAFLRRHEKRLVIQVQTKAFAPAQNCCPGYLSGSEYGGGFYKTSVGAYNPVIWDERVNRRLLALYQALGKQFDDEPLVEAIVIPETAVTGNVRTQGAVPYSIERYAKATTDGMQAAKDAFPHTVVIQFFNLPVEIHTTLFDFAMKHGIGLGGPDIFINDPLLNDPQRGSYPMYKPASNVIPLGTAVQPTDYLIKVHNGPSDPPTPKELYEFGRTKLRLNYLFWSTKSGNFEKVRAMMAEPSFPKDPAGGLNTTLPKCLGGTH